MVVRVKRQGNITAYVVSDFATLEKLLLCPLTRSREGYEYAYLRDISAELFKQIQEADSNTTLVNLTNQLSLQIGQFRASRLERLFQRATNSFFSNSRRGMQSGFMGGVATAATNVILARDRFDPNIIIFALLSVLFTTICGGVIGNMVANSIERHNDPLDREHAVEHAEGGNKIVISAFFVLMVALIANGLYSYPSILTAREDAGNNIPLSPSL